MFDFINWIIELVSAMFFVSGFFVTYYQIHRFVTARINEATQSGHFNAALVQTGFVLLLTSFALGAAYFDPTNLAGYLNWSLFILIIPLIDSQMSNREFWVRGLIVLIFWLIRTNMYDVLTLVSIGSISALLLLLRWQRNTIENSITYRLGIGLWAAMAFWLTQTQLSTTNQFMNTVMFIIINIFSLVYWTSERLSELEHMRLTHQVNSDALTGAGSYFAFQDDLYLQMHVAQVANQSLMLAMYDLDRFKYVNDQYGHQAGNDTLQQVSGVVQKMLDQQAPQNAKLYRTGGEEFNIIFLGMSAANVHDICSQILECVRQTTVQTDDQHISVTLSMGVTSLRSNNELPKDLYERADALLYRSKQHGRDQISFD